MSESSKYIARPYIRFAPLRWLVSLLPPIKSVPSEQEKKLTVLQKPKLRHYRIAVLPLASVLVVFYGLLWLFPVLANSPVTILGALLSLVLGKVRGEIATSFLFYIFLYWFIFRLIGRPVSPKRKVVVAKKPQALNISARNVGAIELYAYHEEFLFRRGSENWTKSQRVVSCALFGLAHIYNMIFPLAVLPALAVGGSWLMVVYLRAFRRTGSQRQATKASALVHAAYNHLVLRLLIPAVLIYLVATAFMK